MKIRRFLLWFGGGNERTHFSCEAQAAGGNTAKLFYNRGSIGLPLAV